MGQFSPRLSGASTAIERMDALCGFIEFWLGRRLPEYGLSQSELNRTTLPMPLRRLYEFAGRWPSLDVLQDSQFVVGAFSKQDALHSFEKLQKNENGKVSFLSENQGNWICRTLSEGEDPPVWCEGDFFNAQGEVSGGEKLVCDSLSRFLITFVLQEMSLGSRCSLADEGLIALFRSSFEEAVPIWLKAPYVYGNDADFYLWRGVFVANLWGKIHFGANHDQAITYLAAHQGPIVEVGIRVGMCWSLDIRYDGSAIVSYRSEGIQESVRIAPHSFGNFENLASRLLEISSAEMLGNRDLVVFPRRQGQSFCEGRFLPDAQIPTRIFRIAIEQTDDPARRLASLFRERWPYC